MSTPLSISIPTNTAKVGIPEVAYDTWVRLRLNNISQDTNEKGPVITFEWELQDPASASDGSTILPGQLGSKIFERIYCYTKPDAKDAANPFYIQKISKRIDAILRTGDAENKKGLPARPEFNGETAAKMFGGIAFARFGPNKQQDGSERSEIKEVKHPEDMKQ